MKWCYLPNMITLLRLFLVLPFIYCTAIGEYRTAFYIFIFASISDGLDGFLARRFQWQSNWGAFCDPLADKILVVSSYLVLAWLQQLPLWFVVLMVSRDIVIVAGVIIWQQLFKKIRFKPTFISKINTVLQLMLIIFVLFLQGYQDFPFHLIRHLADYLIIITTATTAFSFIDYVVRWSFKAIRKKHAKKSVT